MASGTISLGKSNQIEGRITWSSTTNIADNNSTVSATIQVRRTDTYTTTGTWSGTLKIGSTEKTFSVHSGVSSGWFTLLSFNITKAHSSGGSGTCYIGGSIQGPSGTSQANSKVSGNETVTLDLIPRAATITSASNFTDEGTPTLGYSNPAGNSITSLQACIASQDGNTIYIGYRDISKTGTSYSFSLTTNERNLLRNLCSTSNSMTIKYYLKTVIGSNTYYNSVSKTLSIINAAPTLSPTVKDTGSVSITLTGDANNKFIKGYNSMAVAANAAIKKGATLKSISVSCGSKSISSGSGTLSNVENDTFIFTVTDSRGNTAKQEVKKTMLNYVTLTCNLNIKPPTTDGDLSFSINGNYFNGSFGTTSNSLKVEYRYKTNSGSWGSWTTVSATKSGNTYSAPVSMSGLNYMDSYTFQARAADVIYNGTNEDRVTTPEKKIKTLPVFDWDADSFAHHTPIFMDNTKQIWHKDTEGNDVLMMSLNASNQAFFGYGTYSAGIGSTYFDGNVVNIRSKNNITNTASGTIGGNKAWTNSSDSRLKEDIADLPQVFCDIWQDLQPKMFRWIDGDNTLHFGLIAQEVIEVFSKYGLDYRNYGFVSTIPVDGVDYFAITYEYYNIITAQVLKNTLAEVNDLKKELASIKTALAG